MNNFQRDDGRSADQIRGISSTCGVLSGSDGSSRFKIGETIAIASVVGPFSDPMPRLERSDRARINVILIKSARVKDSYQETPMEMDDGYNFDSENPDRNRDIDAETLIKGIFESVVNLNNYPRKLITLRIQIIDDNGSCFACALLACTAALLDAGIDMLSVPSAACCVVQQPERGDRIVLVDPTLKEMSSDDTKAHLFVCTDGDGDSSVLALISNGEIPVDAYMIAVNAASNAALSARSFLRLSFKSTAEEYLQLRRLPQTEKNIKVES